MITNHAPTGVDVLSFRLRRFCLKHGYYRCIPMKEQRVELGWYTKILYISNCGWWQNPWTKTFYCGVTYHPYELTYKSHEVTKEVIE